MELSNLFGMFALRVEFLLHTYSGYPKDTEVAIHPSKPWDIHSLFHLLDSSTVSALALEGDGERVSVTSHQYARRCITLSASLTRTGPTV